MANSVGHNIKNSRPPIIALAAHVTQGDSEKCLSAAMDDYIAKEFDRTHTPQLVSQMETQFEAVGAALRVELTMRT